MTYESYIESTKPGEVVMSLMEYEQSLDCRGDLAVYTIASRLKDRWGEVQHFTVLAHSAAEAKRLAANDRYPNNVRAAAGLYAELEIASFAFVTAGACVVDYFTETIGL